MSYKAAAALQAAVYQRMVADTAISALVGTDIYDAVPPGPLPPTYVSLGPEDARDKSDITGEGVEHDFTVSVVTDASGFQTAKQIAGAVAEALVGADLILATGTLVDLWFLRARARRVGEADQRRIDLWFRARVCLN
jgi:hypothetical protein